MQAARKSRILVFTRHTPLPTDDGAGGYLFDILYFLREKGLQTDVLWFKPADELMRRGWYLVPTSIARAFTLHFPDAIRLGRLHFFPRRIYLPWKARMLHGLKVVLKSLGLFSYLRKTPAQPSVAGPVAPPSLARDPLRNWMSLPTNEEFDLARHHTRQLRPDILMANFCWMNELFTAFPEYRGRRISLTVDVAHHRSTMLARITGSNDNAFLTAEEEQRLLALADLIVAISDADAEVFREFLPDHPIVVAPKAVMPQQLVATPVTGRLLFVGSHNQPNFEGLSWFLDTVWPLVIETQPGAHLHVVGSIGQRFTRTYPQVSFLGKLEDLRQAYKDAEIVIVPLLNGSGMKIKLVEACAFGKACVTTSVGLQGLPFLADCTLCADDTAAFAAAVSRLLGDTALRSRLEEASLSAAETHLSPEKSYAALWQWMIDPVRTSQIAMPVSRERVAA
jgi:glycosyltransferase involved in cell wall biosynthesis